MKKEMTRRDLNKGLLMGLAGLAFGGVQAFGSRRAMAQSVGAAGAAAAAAAGGDPNKILIMCPFRGGMDSLHFLPTFGLSTYYQRRPTLAVAAQDCLRIGSDVVGMHPMFSPLYQRERLPSGATSSGVWADGDMALIQKVGYPGRSLSHFHSGDIFSTACTRGSASKSKGWMARMADQHFTSSRSLFSIGSGRLDTPDLRTADPLQRPLALNDMNGFLPKDSRPWIHFDEAELAQVKSIAGARARRLPGGHRIDAKVAAGIRDLYTQTNYVKGIDSQYQSSIQYPTQDWDPTMGGDGAGMTFGQNLQNAAKLIQNESAVRTLIVENPVNWDMHENQQWLMRYHAPSIVWALDAFIRDVKAMGRWNDVCIVLYSEFGRGIGQNGNGGTDHGHGQTMVVLGGGVNGGLFGGTPTERDLRFDNIGYSANDNSCTDFRAVYNQILRDHMRLPNIDRILPESFVDNGVINTQNQDLIRRA